MNLNPVDLGKPQPILDPLSLLKREADGMRHAIGQIDEQIVNATVQKAGLVAMVSALDNEMDRLRAAAKDKDQLEFDLGD